jgi:hypothetical protein
MVARWLTLGLGAALLAGCVSPYYAPYPAPLYVQPPLYDSQPAVPAPLPAPVPYYLTPETRPYPAPEPLPAPELVPDPTPDPEPSPMAPSAGEPEAAVPPAPPAAQAGRGAETPLQGFRPMRGQTRPGL